MEHHSLPVFFEKIDVVKDGRFTLAKVYIAHVGENRNRCYFSKEVLESMIPSLSNIPILAYVKEDENGNMDFGNHEKAIVKKGKQLYLRYEGHAYGVVPVENNARFEMRYGEDGIEREYLVCDVLLWNKFDDVIDIIKEGQGFKNQSMELFPPSIKGYKNENEIFVFQEAQFEGLCLLGDDVTPAMISSTIEMFSTVKEDYQEMIAEFNTLFSAKKGETMEDINKQEVETPTETPVEENQPVAENQPVEDFAENPVEEPTAEPTEPVEQPVETPAETPVEEFAKEEDEEDEDDKEKGEDEDDKKDKFTVQFELSHDDIRTGLYKALNDHETFGEGWYWIPQVFDNHFLVEMEDENKMYKVNYVKHENAVSIGEYQEVFKMVVTEEEKHGIEQHRATIAQMQEQLTQLQEYKNGIEYAEKEEKLKSFSHILDKESYEAIHSNLKEFSVVDIEKEVGLFVLRNQTNFSAVEQSENRVVATGESKVSTKYGSLQAYFTK